jgi:integrase
MWLTGLMCGLRPGELAGLRWPFVDVNGDEPSIDVVERASEVGDRYAGQAKPKTARRGRIGLHPLVVAALRRHRDDMRLLGLYDPEGFVFCTRNGTAQSLSNLRRAFQQLCDRAGLVGQEWTTYELRHSFVSLVADQLDDLVKVADLAGHADTRTTQGYRHAVRPSLPHAIEAWDRLLGRDAAGPEFEAS